ncbi:MAG: sigma-70 family RNA polymerase sigma factor [Acidobacteriaceae bacterium]|nr:sigma-70 family RNA polymerase sigma factor [Acidobacteriaceae bacterium]MBV8570100.1 sigma-70 family RNA polymerase sigma factor [Acidobacteriaceae bacterium]
MDSLRTRQMQNRAGYCELADETLVKLCQGGDQAAFGELMHRHYTGAMKVAVSITRDKQDAEDEVQNAFWKAYRHIGQFQLGAKFSTWLTRIVVNQCLMRLRQNRRAKFAFIDDMQVGEEIVGVELRDPRPSFEEGIAQTDVAKVLEQEIRRTPPLLRNVFVLRDVQQRPIQEVADSLGISVAAAKSRLLRARAELRNRLRKHCGSMGPATLMAS